MTGDGDGPSVYLATRYSTGAAAYDEVWSPVIRPAGEALIQAMDLRPAGQVGTVTWAGRRRGGWVSSRHGACGRRRSADALDR